MRLENILQNFPNIALASHENNEEILEFFSRFSLKNNQDQVHYHRGPDFFALLRGRGDHLVFTLREDNGELQGVAVVSFRKGYIEGKETQVGYLGDLRVSLNRKLIRQWRACFKEFIENASQLEETRGCRYFQTALMDDNSQSKANLASNKIPGVHYNLISAYQMVNIVGRWRKRKTWKGYSLTPLSNLNREDFSEVMNFLNQNDKRLPFGHSWPFEWDHRKEFWPNFSEDNILVLLSPLGKIVGATSYYDPSPLKKMSLSFIPTPLKISKTLSLFIPGFQQTPLPKKDETLSVLYLENGTCSEDISPEILTNLAIQYLFDHKNFHMIALTEWEKSDLQKALQGMICHKTPMGLYSVHPEDQDGVPLYTKEVSLENYPKGTFPRFDMAMV
jgi:hypothetical protein